MLREILDQEWMDWITHNLSRGCSKEGMLKILVDNGFHPDTASSALECPPPISPPPSTSKTPPREELELRDTPKQVQIPLFPLSEILEAEKAEVFYLKGFLNQEECIELSLLINQHLRGSTTTNDSGEYQGYRTSSTCDLGTIEHPLAADVDRRICQMMGIAPQWGESIQAQRYDVGQQFKAHTDYFEPNSQEYDTYARDRGQRTWTFMAYLNSTLEGGETFFTELGLKIRPRQGDVVIWNNLKADGSPNPNTMHWGMPVTKGYKIVLTKWFRNKGPAPMLTKTANECIRPYTPNGFLKVQTPPELMQKIKAFHDDYAEAPTPETVLGFIDAPQGQQPSELLQLSDALKQEIHQTLTPLMEAWVGTQVVPTFVFGIRRYLKGATLKMHRNKGISHVASAILNVAQDVEEPWPLVIEDHYGRHYHVLLEPGEMVLYEGARLLHGRPYPLNGQRFANIFIHYKVPDADTP